MDASTFLDTVKRVAAKLRAQGLRPNQVVGLKLEPEMQAVFVAAVMHEAAVSLSATKSILENYSGDIDLVVTNSTEWQALAKNLIVVDDDWLASLGGVNSKIEPNDFDSDDALALLVFSSGTTGVPKGVEFTVSDVPRRAAASAKNCIPLQPFFSELGLDTVSGILAYFHHLLNGETHYLPSNAQTNLQIISEAKIRALVTSPAKLIDLSALAKEENIRLDSVQQVLVMGGLLSPKIAQDFAQVCDAQIKYIYGSTEVGAVTRGNYDPQNPECVGEPLEGAFVSVVDEHSIEVANGDSGELRMRTDYQSRTYWRLDLQGQTGFHDGWFIPGDTGLIDSNNRIWITGRVDELVNTAGAKLNPALIDSKLLGYRGIKDLAAFGYNVPDQIHKSLAIAIVTSAEISIENFREHLLDVVPETNDIVIVQVTEIPRNALGKPMRKQLAQMFETHTAS